MATVCDFFVLHLVLLTVGLDRLRGGRGVCGVPAGSTAGWQAGQAGSRGPGREVSPLLSASTLVQSRSLKGFGGDAAIVIRRRRSLKSSRGLCMRECESV